MCIELYSYIAITSDLIVNLFTVFTNKTYWYFKIVWTWKQNRFFSKQYTGSKYKYDLKGKWFEKS
jgi:hypothetical protein